MTDPTGKTVPSLVGRLEGLAAIGLMLPEAREAAAYIQSLTEGSRQLQDLLHEAQQRVGELEERATKSEQPPPSGRDVRQAALHLLEASGERLSLLAKHDPDIFRDVARWALRSAL